MAKHDQVRRGGHAPRPRLGRSARAASNEPPTSRTSRSSSRRRARRPPRRVARPPVSPPPSSRRWPRLASRTIDRRTAGLDVSPTWEHDGTRLDPDRVHRDQPDRGRRPRPRASRRSARRRARGRGDRARRRPVRPRRRGRGHHRGATARRPRRPRPGDDDRRGRGWAPGCASSPSSRAGAPVPVPRREARMMAMAADASPTPVDPGLGRGDGVGHGRVGARRTLIAEHGIRGGDRAAAPNAPISSCCAARHRGSRSGSRGQPPGTSRRSSPPARSVSTTSPSSSSPIELIERPVSDRRIGACAASKPGVDRPQLAAAVVAEQVRAAQRRDRIAAVHDAADDRAAIGVGILA